MAEALRDKINEKFCQGRWRVWRLATTALMKSDCFQYLADEGQTQGSVLASFPINGSSSTKK
jgi:hypothetical protein